MNLEKVIASLIIFSLSYSFKLINMTHFSCDQDKILSLNKLNDDFCDCVDGTDESKTNACHNGVFTCQNRFYRPVNISTYKVNDGICDCCDGSDEFLTKNCPKMCIDLSKKDYNLILEKYNLQESILKNLEISVIQENIDAMINKTDQIIQTYKDLEELNEKHFLILSYLNNIRKVLGDEDFDKFPEYTDDNGLVLRELKETLNKIGKEIYQKEETLEENGNYIHNLMFFIHFKGKEQECKEISYKSMTMSICLMGRIEIFGNKGRYWNKKSIGQFSRIENNTIYYSKGDRCGYYNKEKTSKINIECGNEESLKFVRKNNGCEYELVYNTKFGCNYHNLQIIRNKMLLYLKEI